MAAELRKFISDQLQRLPGDHPDIEFLKEELKRVDERLYLENIDPRKRLEELIKNQNGNPRLSAQTIKGNEQTREHCVSIYGDQTIANTMPTDSRLFADIVNGLRREKINTKQDLLNKAPDEIANIRGIGEVRLKVVLAIRNVLMSEAKSSQHSSSR